MRVNVRHRFPSVKLHVTGILETREFLVGNDSRVMSGFGQHLIPLLDVAANHQPLVVLVQLVEVVCHFLPARLQGEIGLSKGNDFFARVAVLHDQVTGVTGEPVIENCFRFRPGRHFDRFPDLGKMVGD